MESSIEKGKRFQEHCRRVLGAKLGRALETEAQITLPNGQSHRFDLSTPQRDIVVECKAYTWTKTGNIPSAKITHLRESLQLLNSLPGLVSRLLIIMIDVHPRKNQTLGEYFVRLIKVHLGNVNIFEASQETNDLLCLHGELPHTAHAHEYQDPDKRVGIVAVEQLGRMRRSIFHILDFAEGAERRDEGPAKRVSRLRSEGKLPRTIANCMHTILGFRDSAEYEGHSLTQNESETVLAAWKVIVEWAQQKGWDIST